MVWYGRGVLLWDLVCVVLPNALKHGRAAMADYVTNGYGYPKQTTSCPWPYVVPIGEDPAAHGHWCAFTDLYHTIPYHTIPWD